jgi:hypothetical protein
VKPGDFLLGVLDFFAVLLPGSLATWLAAQYVPPNALRSALWFGLGDGRGNPDPVVLGVAFLLSSYVLGHFVFMAGSSLDELYDQWRKRAKPEQSDKVYRAARALHCKLTEKIAGGDFTTLKWARTYIQLKAPEARIEIDRLEADSKFFRSLVVVSMAGAGHFMLRDRAPDLAAFALLMAALSYRRYRQQRWKSTELSYATAVIIHRTLGSDDESRTARLESAAASE